MSSFNELYLDALASVDTSHQSAVECINISKDRFEQLKDILHGVIKEFADAIEDSNQPVKRTELWVKALYEMEPKNFLEVFYIGNMIGTFENGSTNIGMKSSSSDSSSGMEMVKMMGIHMGTVKLERDIQENPENALESVRMFKQFVEDVMQS